jgi:PAS domain S-box-containing protein
MVQSKPQLPHPLSAVQGIVLAVFSVVVSLGLALLMERFQFGRMEVPLFLFAVAITSWYGRGGAAAVALVLSCLSFDYFFTQPLYTLNITRSDLPYFIAFTAFALLVAWFASIRRRVELELLQSRDQLRIEVAERTQQASLLNLTHDTIFVRDMSDIITYWNRGAQEMYGWTPGEAVGKQAHELLHTVFPVPVDDVRAELLRSGRWDGEVEKSRADGTQVVVASRWSLRRDELGQPAAILETNNDITERKRREEEIRALNEELGKRATELEAVNKELEAFAYSISHDLRAPLRHMAGFTELLQKNAASILNEKCQRYVGILLESAKRMGNLIDDLLAFSRIGRAEAHKKLVGLDELVQEALSQTRNETQGRDIEWKVGELPAVYGDGSMLRLVLVNLMSNAAKFTRTRPKAEIEIGCVDQQPDQIVIFIRDNGVGFNMKYVNKLFGVFQRLHPPELFEGTGIGLATVQRIVHRHGGRVWAESLENHGATFYFSLSKSKGA